MIDRNNRNKYLRLTRDMEIPDNRREPNEANLKWFLRNGLLKNAQHMHVYQALEIAKQFCG